MPTFKLLALGDSVVWGQGLQESHKFDRQIASVLGRGGRTVGYPNPVGAQAFVQAIQGVL
jgi:lysophospholipase L1-like esterase